MNKVNQKNLRALRAALLSASSAEDEIGAGNLKNLKNLTREFLKRDNHPHRVQLLLEFEAGLPLTGKEGIRKKLAAFDLEYFGKAYFPHYFQRKTPDFHRALDHIWTAGVLKGEIPDCGIVSKEINRLPGCKRVTAAPRGHAKSTNLTFKGTLHAVLYEYKHYPIILSDSSGQAEGFLESIRVELEENEAILEDFGSLEGAIWRNDVLVTKTNIIIEAIGSGKKVRGRKHRNWRPDLFIMDDVENDENVRTPEQRAKLRDWYDKAVSKAGDSYTDFIFIGTMLHYDSLLARVMHNPSYKSMKYQAVIAFSSSPLWTKWEQLFTDLSNGNHEDDAKAYFLEHETEMLEGTEVLWEARNPYYELMCTKVSEGDASFFSEFQNEPINPEDCLFQEEWFDTYNPFETDFSGEEFEFFGFVDPSLGKSKKSDFSAIITIAKSRRTGFLYVEDADIERRHPDAIIEDVLQKAIRIRKQYGKRYVKFGVETVQFQWFLKEALAKESAKRGIYLPIVEVPQTSDKTLRIQTLQPDIKNKYIKFQASQRRLLDQLKFFPMADHDDGPDALEGCRSLCVSRKKKMIRKGRAIGI